MNRLFLISALAVFFVYNACADCIPDGDFIISDFEHKALAPESYWNGSDGSGGFGSGLLHFYNDYDPAWGGWSGWSYSNVTDNETAGWMNQYGAITGGGVADDDGNGSVVTGTYAVAYNPRSLTFQQPAARVVKGLYITNSTYAALSMRHGDDFSRKFGGENGDEPDWFKLSVWGLLHGRSTDTIAFYLADFRHEDKSKHYIVDSWEWLELSSLGRVDSLMFSLSSSDNGDWGMNTPAYFCVDHICVERHLTQPAFIHEVLDYVPAPGQFINKEPLGLPASAASIIGGVDGGLSLGAFGGYVVFRFEQPVLNHPDHPYGVDFILYGNPLNGFSEPGIVSVMKDENGNGLPDDTWYELAGSDYFFSSTLHQNELTYFNPEGEGAADVFWEDNAGNSGFVYAKVFHEQSYYPDVAVFAAIDPHQYTLSGTRIAGGMDYSDPMIMRSRKRAFGYADNNHRGSAPFNVPGNPYTEHVENAGGDGFDLRWAVDSNGNYVDLDMIHFIKVHTGMAADAGWLGEISTEITGGVMVSPDSSIQGFTELIVIEDLPEVITTSVYQLQAFAYEGGRLQKDRSIVWSTDMEGAEIDENGLLQLSRSGDLTVKVSLASNAGVYAAATCRVEVSTDPTSIGESIKKQPTVYPNPARHRIQVNGIDQADLVFYNSKGVVAKELHAYTQGQPVDLVGLPAGLYFVHIYEREFAGVVKLVIIE